MITYQEEKLKDCLWEMVPLFEKHYEEIALHKDKIDLNPDYESYLKAEELGTMHTVTARDDGELIGYFVSIVSPSMHYRDHLFAVNDVLFIDEKYRGRMAGVKLFKKAEGFLKELGVSVIYIHMKVYADFGVMLERLGYSHVENQYSKYIGE